MKKQVILAAIMSVLGASSAWAGVNGVKELPNGALYTVDGGVLQVQVWSDDVIRVTYANGAEIPKLTSLSVIATPVAAQVGRQETADAYILSTAKMKVKVDKKTGAVSMLDSAGGVILQESAEGRKMEKATQQGIEGDSCAQLFDLPADEGIFGLGQHQKGDWNYRLPNAQGTGSSVRLAQANMDVGVPVIASNKGYVILWDNPAITTISAGGPSGTNVVRWYSEFGRAIDYYICYNDGTLDTAFKAYRHLTGEAPLMPKWMLGFWQCKERYASQKEMIDVATRYREMKVPVDGIIQDWQYWTIGNGNWGSHGFDPARYPDPDQMFKDLKAMNYHTLISVWAKFDLGSANSKELNEKGGMFEKIERYVSPPGQGQWYNPFVPAGRETYFKQMKEQLLARGTDGWWLDAPEPEINGNGFRQYDTGMGKGYTVYNAYPLMHSKGIYEGQRAATSDKRVVILTRSAYAGQQRNSAITWSGDIGSSWQVLKNQVPAGLNFSMSGIPYWNTDTGGFFGDRNTGNATASNPAYQEIFSRWFQFSSFCPMFRVHGSYGDTRPGKEIWRFAENTQNIMRQYLDLRYRLMPYTYSVAWKVTSESDTFMRPLVMDFPKDPKAVNVGNQYFFGPSILVTPVTTAGATTQAVYLPKTTGQWTNFWTGAKVDGGQSVDTAAPVETMPLYVKPGAIIPTGPFVQYTSEKPADPLEIRVYPGANGAFTLYEDEGDNYNYEKGAYATIPFNWDEASKTLTIGQRKGDFKGMIKDRTFNIVLVGENHGAGIPLVEKPDQSVKYSGGEVKVKIGG